MEFVEYLKEKPSTSDYYFVKGKKGMKSLIFFDAENDCWDIPDELPRNYFNDVEIFWLKE